jgi:hypothetical protein
MRSGKLLKVIAQTEVAAVVGSVRVDKVQSILDDENDPLAAALGGLIPRAEALGEAPLA